MKLTIGILILGMGLGTAAAQNPSVIDTTKARLSGMQQKQTADSNAALAASQGQQANPQPAITSAKPTAGTPASSGQGHAASQVHPAHQQAATVSPASAPKTKAKTKKKTTSVVVKAPKQPKSAVAVEDKKNPVDPKKDAHKTISMQNTGAT